MSDEKKTVSSVRKEDKMNVFEQFRMWLHMRVESKKTLHGWTRETADFIKKMWPVPQL